MSTPVVYRVYDATDRLIYIGATSNLPQRLNYHRTQAWWWSLAERVTESSVYPDMDAAHEAEWAAIATESPAFNFALKPGRPSSQPRPLSDADLRVCRNWLASKRRGGYLPMPLRWVTGQGPAPAELNVA
jgi:predicted GIY-YIG superfamily endonuclease